MCSSPYYEVAESYCMLLSMLIHVVVLLSTVKPRP